MKYSMTEIMQWLALGEAIFVRGQAAYDAVKAAAAAHGIDEDTAMLDAVIRDAEQRKKLAQDEVEATK